MAYRFSCSSGLISGRARLFFTEQFFNRHFLGSIGKRLQISNSNLEHSWSLYQHRNPPGADVDRHLGIPSTLLRNFKIVCFVRSSSDFFGLDRNSY